MPTRHRKTKIVATIGPASSPEKRLRELIHAGVDVCRLNFSHGTHDQHKAVFDRIRRIEKDLGRPVAILQDLCGPKIRVTKLPGGKINLTIGNEVEIIGDLPEATKKGQIGATYPDLAEEVEEGQRILLDDGHLELKVLGTEGDVVRCLVVQGGPLKDGKGINLPDTKLTVPSLTDKDKTDLAWGLKHGVDYVALSFVRHEDDAAQVRALCVDAPHHKPRIIAKVEKPEAVARMEQIVDAFDGIMVARGDLAVEMPLHDVPAIQKRLIRECNLRDRPCITATQMLDSMQENPRPTRAEVSDVANAIHDGTDAIMLSGETAAGKFPVETVRTMSRIAEATEVDLDRSQGSRRHASNIDLDTFCDSICGGAVGIAEDLNAKVLVAFTDTGRTALLMSKYHPTIPILGVTNQETALRWMCLYHGVVPILVPPTERSEELVNEAEDEIEKRGYGVRGDLAVCVGGSNLIAKGNINSLKVRRIGDHGGV
ncbi:pyruvate kinase [Planctomycetota bacterium]|nr:pyruvate kinase [Planctomycetota bacterium]